MSINYLFIFLSGFLLNLVFIFLFKRISSKYSLLIYQGIPLIGGIAIALSFVLSCSLGFFLLGRLPEEAIGIIIASLIIFIFGVIDDWRELSIVAKFLFQVMATLLLVIFGVKTQIAHIGNPLNIMITFVWVLGITNAFNHLDIMDGLAAGTAAIVGSALFAICLLNGDINMAILSLAVTTISISFLIYNFPPARIYMGNSGSHFLGFVLAAIALAISYAPLERKIALLSPLLILGFPIFDTTFIILMRINKKRLPFKKTNDHLALRFLALGHSKKKVLSVMLALCLFFALCGVAVSQVPNLSGIIIIAFLVLVTLALAMRLSKVIVDE
jgi:UDP-GlcNAc:undecaprenyl-phosphate GlcNAc-1-phosphate transferase